MTEPKWTPGPWALVDFEDDSNMIVVIDAAGARWIAAMKHGTNQTRANANLIAAAPDLYAATDLPGINGIEFSDTMADDSKMELHLTVGQFRALQAARRKARGE